MAHSCPDCDQACYCNGDLDDLLLDDDEAVDACGHCDPFDDDEEWDFA